MLLKRKHKNHLNRYRKTKTHRLRNKNRYRNNKEITKEYSHSDRKPKKEIKSHRCRHHQQNARDRRKTLRCRDTRENSDTLLKKMRKAKAPNPKRPGNPGHNEKTKPKDSRYRRE